jgi:predicted small secreted protein
MEVWKAAFVTNNNTVAFKSMPGVGTDVQKHARCFESAAEVYSCSFVVL